MKSSRGLAAVACLLQLACAGESVRLVRTGIPGYTPLRSEEIGEIILTDFRVEESPKDFDLGQELGNYLYGELARKFEGKVVRRPIPAGEAGLAEDHDFWKSLPAGPGPALFLTGTVGFREQVRKALLESDPKVVDGPFRRDKAGLAEKRLFMLKVAVSLIRAGSGQVVLSKTFDETTIFYTDDVPAGFAFDELAAQFRQRLFQTFFGDPRIQERYLFTR